LERFDDTLFPNLLGKYREAGMGVTDIPETFHVLKCSSQTKANIGCIFLVGLTSTRVPTQNIFF
jgi:hypothetical protein